MLTIHVMSNHWERIGSTLAENRQAACDPTTCHIRAAGALAIREDELKNMTQRLLPVAVSGDPINIKSIATRKAGW